jgi:hypothetical protein
MNIYLYMNTYVRMYVCMYVCIYKYHFFHTHIGIDDIFIRYLYIYV